MTVTYPRTDIDIGNWIQSVRFVPSVQQEISRSPSRVRVKQIAPTLWTATVTTVSLPNDRAMSLQSKLISLNGAEQFFELSDPRRKRPIASSYTGTAVLGTLPASASSMVLTGLPSGFILSEGDYLSFTYGSSRRAFHQVLEKVTANGSGVTPAFDVYPQRRTGTTAGATVSLSPAKALMYLVPGTLVSESDGPLTSKLSFEASE